MLLCSSAIPISSTNSSTNQGRSSLSGLKENSNRLTDKTIVDDYIQPPDVPLTPTATDHAESVVNPVSNDMTLSFIPLDQILSSIAPSKPSVPLAPSEDETRLINDGYLCHAEKSRPKGRILMPTWQCGADLANVVVSEDSRCSNTPQTGNVVTKINQEPTMTTATHPHHPRSSHENDLSMTKHPTKIYAFFGCTKETNDDASIDGLDHHSIHSETTLKRSGISSATRSMSGGGESMVVRDNTGERRLIGNTSLHSMVNCTNPSLLPCVLPQSQSLLSSSSIQPSSSRLKLTGKLKNRQYEKNRYNYSRQRFCTTSKLSKPICHFNQHGKITNQPQYLLATDYYKNNDFFDRSYYYYNGDTS
jgi:hypothetical protein